MVKAKGRRGREAGYAKFTQSDGNTQVAAEGFRRLTFFTPEETAAKLKAVAAFQGVPTSKLLNQIIDQYLKGVKIKI